LSSGLCRLLRVKLQSVGDDASEASENSHMVVVDLTRLPCLLNGLAFWISSKCYFYAMDGRILKFGTLMQNDTCSRKFGKKHYLC